MSFIFKSLFKTLSLLLHVSIAIAYHHQGARRRYAIETCRSSESVLKSDLKINDIQLVHLLVV